MYYKKHIIFLSFLLTAISCNNFTDKQTSLNESLFDNKIYVKDISGEIGFYLRQNLRFYLKDNGTKKSLSLNNEINISTNEYGLSSSNQITRKDLIAKLTTTLKKNETTHTFNIDERVSFDVSQSSVANKAAEQNASKRLANLLTQAILTELHHMDHDWLK